MGPLDKLKGFVQKIFTNKGDLPTRFINQINDAMDNMESTLGNEETAERDTLNELNDISPTDPNARNRGKTAINNYTDALTKATAPPSTAPKLDKATQDKIDSIQSELDKVNKAIADKEKQWAINTIPF